MSDARTGAQVWSKTFKVTVGVANLLAIQDEISGQASAMIGSYWGAIGTAEYKRIQTKSSEELTPYECIVQGVIGTPNRRDHSGAGRKSAGLPGALDSQGATKRRRLGGSCSGLQQSEDVGLRFADRRGG